SLQTSFFGSFASRKLQLVGSQGLSSSRKIGKLPIYVKCSTKDGQCDPSSVERPPYYSYMDSTSGQLEPASGARASIPGQEYWPEGTVNRVNAARAPEPTGISVGNPSYGKTPGSRRRKYKGRVAASESAEATMKSTDSSAPLSESSDDTSDESKDPSEEYVIYQTEVKEENLSTYELDKRLGNPHPFVDPAVKKPIEEPRTSEELWWNWRKPEKEQWSRWQRRRPDVETVILMVFAKAMAETGQIKLYGDHPTITETTLARARKNVFKEERYLKKQVALPA
ncbi:hypothetical protein Taro_013824, partial [Colocasia esculenta]|nr:hypothetical protein [Colocasia esculenta]